MNINRRSILMVSGVAAMAFFIGALMPAGTILNANQMSDPLTATGYVTVSVMRDGQEIYHHEDHNAITEAGLVFFADKISGTASTATLARFIGLTNATFVADDDNSTLTGEFTTGGLERVSATTFTAPTGGDTNDSDYQLSHQFDATADFPDVQAAGLWTAVGGGTLVAINTFTPVDLQNGDSLTITWTIDFGATLN